MNRRLAAPADIALLAALKGGAMLLALHAGFAQISDDDYARTVIAQTFAHAPSLDPSGTSWLPFPFWLYGGVMMVFGRSLATARVLAFVLGVLAPAVLYLGLRSMLGADRGARFVAVAGAALVALTPWSVWLGLAPVPEGWAGLLVGASFFFMASRTPRGAVTAGALLLAATLSRYEAWPAAALVALVALARARPARNARTANLACALLAAFGPLAWIAHNAIAHGDAFHFFARVAAYRRANAGAVPLADRMLEYPRALLADAPVLTLVGVLGLTAFARDRAFRARWALPLAGAAIVTLVLVAGDVRDGAPTHHPARALVSVMCVLAGMGVAAIAEVAARLRGRAHREAWGVAALAFCVIFGGGVTLARVRAVPGNGPADRRDAQLARGRALAAEGVTHLTVTPCAYEHFALIAAFGAPERATIVDAPRRPVTDDCPAVVTAASP